MKRIFGKLIFIHGCSSVGKSFIGRALQFKLEESILIDQDSFFKKDKPLVTIIVNGQDASVSNYDCDEAIDYDKFTSHIKLALGVYKYVIVTGFALRNYLVKCTPDYGFILFLGCEHDMQKTTEKIIKQRRISKKFATQEKIDRDAAMVNQVVLPYFSNTLAHLDCKYHIDVFDGHGDRVSCKDILNIMLGVIKA